MTTLERNGVRIETAAVPEVDGSCCVTAEVFEGEKMIGTYYRLVKQPQGDLAQAEREIAESVARMAAQAE